MLRTPGLVVAALAGLGALVWGLGTLLLWGGQEQILFPAPTIPAAVQAARAAAAGARVHHPTAADGARLVAWQVPAGGQRAVLYFHGNGESVATTGTMAAAVTARGWDFLTVSPRGYPGTSGAPRAGSLALDARAAWAWATTELGLAPDRIVLHGRSLGGGLVGHIIAENSPAGVIFESTFLSVRRLAQARFPLFPVGLLLRHPAPTEDHLAGLRAPTLVLHGARDRVIPVAHGRGLAAAVAGACYVEVADQGHNDGLLGDPVAQAAWADFLDGLRPAPAP